jgi:hypothetical protein
MGRITFGGVAEWVKDMQREGGRSASRVRHAYHLLTGMLHAAVRDGRLPRSPAIGVDLPRLTRRSVAIGGTTTARPDHLGQKPGGPGVRLAAGCGSSGSPTSDAATSTEQRSRSAFGACLALTAARSGVARHVGRRVGQERAADARARVDTLTLDGYGHLSPDVLDDVARRMDAAARHAGVTERVQKRNRCCPRPMVRWQ